MHVIKGVRNEDGNANVVTSSMVKIGNCMEMLMEWNKIKYSHVQHLLEKRQGTKICNNIC